MALNLQEIFVEKEIAGRKLKISTGLMAKQAAGSVLVQYGETIVLTAVTHAPAKDSEQDFFPLMVDYREKSYAAGKFPGGFFKREKAPSVQETLTMRLTDRPIRPLFPEGFYDEVLIQSMALSADLENNPDILSIIGASAALTISELPFEGPIAAVSVGMIDNKFIINPTYQEEAKSGLKLILAGTYDSINMVEAGASEISEDKMAEALIFGHQAVKEIIELINELAKKAQKKEKITVTPPTAPTTLNEVRTKYKEKLKNALCTPSKSGRRDAVNAVAEEIVAELVNEDDNSNEKDVKTSISTVKTEIIRELIQNNTRIDGRDNYTVRPIDCRLDILPRTHGSALFTRGETQALVTVTLGSTLDTQEVDTISQNYKEKWYLHYNAPGFSVGEAKMPRGPGRREIGHGMLAQRALEAVMPHEEGFPYTIRAVSEILEMNGSSSMASVCGATLALMDAGVPIKRPVAGIAMGLIQEKGSEPVIISDILGDEDHYGDMDFKVCGTEEGITALQMDIKVKGISAETMLKALKQAKEGRLHILGEITKCIKSPREELNSRAPRLYEVKIPSEFVGKVIGPGGKTIRAIQEECGVVVEINDAGNCGVVSICAPDEESMKKAINKLESLVEVAEIGKIYEGKVTSIRDFGIFVEIFPDTEGMCHISELDDKRVESTENFCKVGDIIRVKVVDIDEMGKIRLSRKAILMEEKGEVYQLPPRKPAGNNKSQNYGNKGGRR